MNAKRYKKLLAGVLTLAMLCSLLPGTALAEEEAQVEILIGGTKLTSGTYYKTTTEGVLSADGSDDNYQIYFDAAQNWLTLNAAVIKAENVAGPGGSGIKVTYPANDSELSIQLVGETIISGGQYAISAWRKGNIPSTSSDVDVQLNITGDGSLVTDTEWGMEVTNLTVDGATLTMTTGGHSALRINRDCTLKNGANITTHDTGDGGDFYIDRSFTMIGGTVDLSDINVDYPAIFVANTYVPDEHLVPDGINIQNSTLTLGGKKSGTGIPSLLLNKGNIVLEVSALIIDKDTTNTGVRAPSVTVSGSSSISAPGKIALDGINSLTIGKGVLVQGNVGRTGKPVTNHGSVFGKVLGDLTPESTGSATEAAFGGDVSGTGLDFSATVPSVPTVYLAGEGRILFTPVDGETPATLELNNAVFNVTSDKSAIILPRDSENGASIRVVLIGENRITANPVSKEGQLKPGTFSDSVISAGKGTTTFSGTGSLAIQTGHLYGISVSEKGALVFDGVSINIEATRKNAGGYASGNCIYSDQGNITVNESQIELWGEGASLGLVLYCPSGTSPILSIIDSELTVRSSGEAVANLGGDLKIQGSEVEIEGFGSGGASCLRTGRKLYITGNSDVTVKAAKFSAAIGVIDLEITDSNVMVLAPVATYGIAIDGRGTTSNINGNSVVTIVYGVGKKAIGLVFNGKLEVAETATLITKLDASNGLDLSTPPTEVTDYVAKEGTLRWEPTPGEGGAVTGGTLTLDGAEMAGDLILPNVPVTLKTVNSSAITGAILGNSSPVSLTVDGAELKVNKVWFTHEDDIFGTLTLKNGAQITIPAGEEPQAVRVGTLQVSGSKLTASGSGSDGVPVIYLADAFSATDGANITVIGGDIGVYSTGTIAVDSSSKLVTDTTQAAVVVVDKTNALTGEAALDLPIPGGHERASVNDEDATYWSVVSTGGSLSVDETGVVTGASHGRLTFEKPVPPPYSGGGSNTTTSTEKNPDGSTTTTVTNKTTGTVTETTKHPDGKVETVETKKDGTMTEKVATSDGTKTEQVKKPDGSLTATEERKDGTKLESATTADGKTTATVAVPDGGIATIIIPTPAKPAPGEVAVIVKEDGTKEVVKTSIATEGGLKITIPDGGKLEIIDNSKTFGDVADSAWYAEAVAFASSRELFGGVGKGNFAPEAAMTRAMLWTVLARFDGQDISGGANWYENAQAWAKESGISDGSGPDDGITREQLAVILYRYAGSAEVGGIALSEFGDADSVSAWAADAMLWCVDSGILNGSGGKLNPNGAASRAEVAATLHRYVVLMAH